MLERSFTPRSHPHEERVWSTAQRLFLEKFSSKKTCISVWVKHIHKTIVMCCAHSGPLNSSSSCTYTTVLVVRPYTIESTIHTVAREPPNNWMGWTIHITFCKCNCPLLCDDTHFTFVNANLFAFIYQQCQAFSTSVRPKIWVCVTRTAPVVCRVWVRD